MPEERLLHLNVGGRRLKALKSTLAVLPDGSPLKSLLTAERSPGGSVFVDRSGQHFHHILDFLRLGPDLFEQPKTPSTRQELYREACYFQVSGLVQVLQDAGPERAAEDPAVDPPTPTPNGAHRRPSHRSERSASRPEKPINGAATEERPPPRCGSGNGLEDSQERLLHLNVGGHRLKALKSTFTALPEGSPLRNLLTAERSPGGCVFVDRDGQHFHHILNFLRLGPDLFEQPRAPSARRELYREACYFQVSGLVQVLQDAYPGAPAAKNESARLKRLHNLNVMHTEPEARFDHITKCLAGMLGVPITLVTLVSKDVVWFKSKYGVDATQMPRNTAFCGHALLMQPFDPPSVLVIEDATKDSRSWANPLVVGDAGIRFYAGCPLVTSDGLCMGTLAAMDRRPRKLEPWKVQLMANLAHLVVVELQKAELAAVVSPPPCVELREEELEAGYIPTAADFAGGPFRAGRMKEVLREMVCLVRVRSNTREWPIVYASPQFADVTGVSVPPNGMNSAQVQEASLAPAQPLFWDLFALCGKTMPSLLGQLEEVWDTRRQPQPFALDAQIEPPGGGSLPVLRYVTCRFQPAVEPLDLAAAAVRLSPAQFSAIARKAGEGLEDGCYFFALMLAHGAQV